MAQALAFFQAQGPYIVILFIQFVYAGMALFSKLAIDEGMSPFVFVVYRQGIATLVIAPFAYFVERKKAPPVSFALLCKIFSIALCGITLSLNLFNVALKNTTATMASASTNAIPAITFIMAVILRMEKISVKHSFGVAKLVGSVICVSGAIMVAFYKGSPIMSTSHRPSIQTDHHVSDLHEVLSRFELVKGSLLMLAANTAWSLWLIFQGLLLQAYPAKVHLTAIQCFFSCIQSAILAVILDRNPDSWKLGWDIHLLSVLYCGVIVTGLSYWLQIWCIEKKGPVFTALFAPVSLLITVIFSAFLWKEMLHWGSVGGGLLLVGGLYLVSWGKKKEERLAESGNIMSSKA
ncbi:WAT1-related protein At1g43650 [Aristolochia californica]|uniref:WAT1-related protein At1g43650 n=1 Tax=Aristolochia californica TaxID=171875 RepID=UPI0035DD3D89